MTIGWFALAICCVSFIAMIGVARAADRPGRFDGPRMRTAIYVLGCCAHTSTWLFYGSIDLVTTRGLVLIPVIVGPIVLFGVLGRPLARVVRHVKARNISSIADFVGALYVNGAPVAAMVTLLATFAGVTFVAFQIKLVAASILLFMGPTTGAAPSLEAVSGPLPVVVAVAIGILTIAIATRTADATKHQRGLMIVTAATTVVRLVSFVLVGAYVIWGQFRGPGDLVARTIADPAFAETLLSFPPVPIAVVIALVGFAGTVLWPQQFHLIVVENRDVQAFRHTAWAVPLFFLCSVLFVLPLAVAGHVTFPGATGNRDLTILALPIAGGSPLFSLIALVGGLASVMSLTFVTMIVMAIMLSNDLVLPLLLRRPAFRDRAKGDVGRLVLTVRRAAILLSIVMSYVGFRWIGDAPLTTGVTLSITCIMQIAPACVAGLAWRRVTTRGAMAGLIVGSLVWLYAIVLPLFATTEAGLVAHLVAQGPFGIDALRPTGLFGLRLAPTPHGVVASVAANVFALVVGSLAWPVRTQDERRAEPRAQTGKAIYGPRLAAVTAGQLEATVAQYLGADVSRRSFATYRSEHGSRLDPWEEADEELLAFGERLIASVVGTASSLLIMSFLRGGADPGATMWATGTRSPEDGPTRELLQRVVGLAKQAMSFFDLDDRLVAWNQALRDIFGWPEGLAREGVSLSELIRFTAERGAYGPGDVDELVRRRRHAILSGQVNRILSHKNGRYYDARVVHMPEVGFFVIYSDMTDQAQSEDRLAAENLTLERRVRERTEELERLNAALATAKAQADEANLSKTRFLAAASHDLLQPLNAARLYTASLLDRMQADPKADDRLDIAINVGSSLEAVEDILTALLDISRLDAGAAETEIAPCRLQDILQQLTMDFKPITEDRKLRLTVVGSSVVVLSDRRMLRRMLQNLLSNAIKYTVRGRVIVGVRRAGSHVEIQVWDTGLGIAKARQREIFQEFKRLPSAALVAPGVGLGLSIVERLGRALGHEIRVRSKPGKGSVFSIVVPVAPRTAAAAETATEAPDDQGHGALGGLVIAAIDNEPTILSGLTTLLEGWGCTVVTGRRSTEIGASLQAAGLRPDVIVADYHLDDGDGLAAIDALRTLYGPCHALLATADRSAHVRERAARAGIRVMHKPLKPATLRSLLSQWRLFKDVAE